MNEFVATKKTTHLREDGATQDLVEALIEYFRRHAGFEPEAMILIVKGPGHIQGCLSSVCKHVEIKVLEGRLEDLRSQVAAEDATRSDTKH